MDSLRSGVLGCLAAMTLTGCSVIIEDPHQSGVATRRANLKISGVDETTLETTTDKGFVANVSRA